MHPLAFILILATLTLVGCGQASHSIDTQIKAMGGYEVLKRDCLAYLETAQAPDHKDWVMGKTNDLPTTIAGLRPQIVRMEKWESLPMIDIQISGGFNHHGVLVFPRDTSPPTVPYRSSWKVTKIAEGVFEYRE